MSSVAPWDTAGNCINDAAVEIGLGSASDPFASNDPNFIQLCGLLKSVGRDLWRTHQWTHLQKSYSFLTVTNTATYELPDDFGYIINQTGWNRTNRLPLGGPLSPQEWQYLKGRLAGVVFTVLFRPLSRQIYLYPDANTPGGYTIAYEYASRYWVQASGVNATSGIWQPSTAYTSGTYVEYGGRIYLCQSSGTSGTSGLVGTATGITDGTCIWDYSSVFGADKPSTSTDTILFDPQLVTRALKVSFLKAKGFDFASAEAEYQLTLHRVKGDDSAAQTLRLDRGSRDEPILGERNIPITGFGS